MAGAYFDIDKILADEERVPVTWKYLTPRVGYLDPTSTTEDVEAGTRSELPLWLAEHLHASKIVTVEIPPAFGLRSRAEIRAGARTVRLRDKSPAFYEVGLKLAKLAISDDAFQLPQDVHYALADRLGSILEAADGGYRHDMSAFKDTLTDLELKFFNSVLASHADRLRRRGGARAPKVLLAPQYQAAAAAAAITGAAMTASGVAVTRTTTADVIASAHLPQSKGQKRARTALSAAT